MAKFRLIDGGVLDTETGMSIPAAPGNRHWREFEIWRQAGHEPEPADPPPAQPSEEQQAAAELDQNRWLRALIGVLAARLNVPEAALTQALKAKAIEIGKGTRERGG